MAERLLFEHLYILTLYVHYVVPIETLCLKDLTFLFIRQHKLNDTVDCFGN